ncbi:ExbD/TolR family protein [Maribacter sp. LLG6340-A2]|uniref:ExbD/TolR family protein n=1 Tax=Maribacter sp. LLG6340-A2 TaxID=3160834 RepID=UPI0038694FC0
MKYHRAPQEVNAGSMADIAFLLLIFFLVTTSIENDVGLNRLLPPEKTDDIVDIKERNLFEIVINDSDDIMAENEIVQLENLRSQVIDFIDNGGLLVDKDGYCDYCKGSRLDISSENPTKAIISLKASRNTSYPIYVAVQNEIIGAYNHLRNRESLRVFGTSFETMYEEYYSEETAETKKEKLKEQLEFVRELYPQKILEAETVKN